MLKEMRASRKTEHIEVKRLNYLSKVNTFLKVVQIKFTVHAQLNKQN